MPEALTLKTSMINDNQWGIMVTTLITWLQQEKFVENVSNPHIHTSQFPEK